MHSVASFFVSRVDTEVDKRLAELGREDLRGTAAIANARAAYLRFKEIFHGERFAALREAGCPVQRPLWASTGVKDPHYPETKYVDALIAPAHRQHDADADAAGLRGAARGDAAPTADQDPSAELAALADAGIDMNDVTDKLLRDGIDEVRRAVRQADRGRRADARGHRHRPPADDPARRSPTSSSRALIAKIKQAQSEAGRQAHLAAATSRSGAAPACPRSATGSAGSRSARRCSSTRPS